MRKHLTVTAAILGATAMFSVPALAATHGSAKLAANTTIKTPPPKHYSVQSGDNLSAIAQAQGLDSWRPLWNANLNITNPDLIYPGQDLVIPNGPTADRALPADVSANQLDAAYSSAAAANPRPVVHYATVPAAAPNVNCNTDVPAILNRTKARESGCNYATNTGNGYYGAYQFDIRTWNNFDGYPRADLAPIAVQDAKAVATYNARGCSPWPNTCY